MGMTDKLKIMFCLSLYKEDKNITKLVSSMIDEKAEYVPPSENRLENDGCFELRLKGFTLKIWDLNKYYGWATDFIIVEEGKPDFKIKGRSISRRVKLKLYNYIHSYDHEKIAEEKEITGRVKTLSNSLNWRQ